MVDAECLTITKRNATLIKNEVYLLKGHDYLESLKYARQSWEIKKKVDYLSLVV